MQLLIAQHHRREPPGTLIDAINRRSIRYSMAELWRAPFPFPDTYDGIVVLGGPQRAAEQSEGMELTRRAILRAIENGMPYLGICLGAQLLAHVAGGEVHRGIPEIGWRHTRGEPYLVKLTPDGQNDQLLAGIRDEVKTFQLHQDFIIRTPKIHLLGYSHPVHSQIIRVGRNAYGLQGHIELNGGMLHRWLKEDRLLESLDCREVFEEFKAARTKYKRNARMIFNNYLDIAGF